MARERKPFSKLQPDFILGRNRAGMEFNDSLTLEEQMIYVRWWNYCVESRVIFYESFDESLRNLSQKIGVSFRKFKRTFEKLLAKRFVLLDEKKRAYLKGIKEIHAGYNFHGGDRTGNERGADGGQTPPKRGESLETRVIASTSALSNPTVFGATSVGAQEEAGGKKSDQFGAALPEAIPEIPGDLLGMAQAVFGLSSEATLLDWLRRYDAAWIREVIPKAEARGIRNGRAVGYCRSILQDWQKIGGPENDGNGKNNRQFGAEKSAIKSASGKFSGRD